MRSRAASWITKGTPSAESCTSNSTCAIPCRQADSSAGSVFSGKCSASPRCATIAGSMRRIIVVPWILAALIAAACSRQESGWERARREDSLAAYEDYLARYPAGPHAGEARAALDGLHDAEAWSRAERLATPEAWQRYLGEFPDGRHAAGARQRLIDFIPPGPQPADGRYVVQLGRLLDRSRRPGGPRARGRGARRRPRGHRASHHRAAGTRGFDLAAADRCPRRGAGTGPLREAPGGRRRLRAAARRLSRRCAAIAHGR